MMKKMVFGLAGLVSLASMAASFSYQGVLRGATGEQVADKNKVITFRLYNDPSSGDALWGRTSSVLLDDNGLFNVELGDSTGSPVEGVTNSLEAVISENAAGTLYIGLEVIPSSGEIRPRQKVLSVPLASYAQDVGIAKKDFTVVGKATISGALEVSGETQIKGTASVAKLSVQNGATLAGGVNVTGPLNLSSGKLEMPASSTFTIGGVSAVIPSGVIVMWSGNVNNIPTGWVLCNGENGTPDLRNRFIVGAGATYAVGERGGADHVTLNVDQLPAHDHQFVGDDQLSDRANWSAYDLGRYGNYDADSSSGNSRLYKTTASGGNQSHENRPPYYALCFIMKR
ncbi:MAG: hypothetical protein MJ240_00630 [Kiritimatiellae bacterium]|nr:hypothetical protein [Kiritimatiellia bacterium]